MQPFNGPFSRTTQVSRYQKGKTNLYFTEARDSVWQWHNSEIILPFCLQKLNVIIISTQPGNYGKVGN